VHSVPDYHPACAVSGLPVPFYSLDEPDFFGNQTKRLQLRFPGEAFSLGAPSLAG
jgi:hypothetical protein